jgi:hypothetical protein
VSFGRIQGVRRAPAAKARPQAAAAAGGGDGGGGGGGAAAAAAAAAPRPLGGAPAGQVGA